MSIHKTKTGSYRLKWRENGEQKSKNFDRKIEAEQYEAKLLLGVTVATAPDGRYLTGKKFSEFADMWLTKYATVHKTEGSVINDRQQLRDYLIRRWGKMDLAEISRLDIVNLQSSLTAEGRLSPKTINNIISLTKKVFSDAVKWECLKSSPADFIDQIKLPEQDFRFWTFDERDRFLGWTKVNDYALYEVVAVSVHTGLRKGEQEGLLRDCIDFERRQIIVKRKVCDKTGKLETFTKGKKIRRIPMNDIVYEILLSRKDLPMDAPVLPFDYHHMVQRRMAPAIEKAGVSRITFHDLRHTVASLLAMMGVSAYVIKELLGHASITTTMRYMHLAPDHLQGVTDLLLGVRGINSRKFMTPKKNTHELLEAFQEFLEKQA